MKDAGVVVFVAVICSFQSWAECLQITNIKVPRMVNSGSRIALSCSFQLFDKELYSLTWWRNNQTFFRYLPANRHRKMAYNVPGITVDEELSTLYEVILSHVDHRASGTIKCEVISTPSFEQAYMEANMTVIATPPKAPSITGMQGHYEAGDLLLLNCSSPPSYPPTSLSWDIDGHKASQETVIVYPGEADNVGRKSSWSGLQMWLKESHFSRGILILKCTASILDHYKMSTEVAISSSNHIDVMPRERASTGGAESLSVVILLLLLLLLANLAT